MGIELIENPDYVPYTEEMAYAYSEVHRQLIEVGAHALYYSRLREYIDRLNTEPSLQGSKHVVAEQFLKEARAIYVDLQMQGLDPELGLAFHCDELSRPANFWRFDTIEDHLAIQSAIDTFYERVPVDIKDGLKKVYLCRFDTKTGGLVMFTEVFIGKYENHELTLEESIPTELQRSLSEIFDFQKALPWWP